MVIGISLPRKKDHNSNALIACLLDADHSFSSTHIPKKDTFTYNPEVLNQKCYLSKFMKLCDDRIRTLVTSSRDFKAASKSAWQARSYGRPNIFYRIGSRFHETNTFWFRLRQSQSMSLMSCCSKAAECTPLIRDVVGSIPARWWPFSSYYH